MESNLMGGYSYRTSSRFGSRVKIAVDQDQVTILGPRIGIVTYRLWVALQAVLLGSGALALLAALWFRSWPALGAAVVLLLCHACAGGFGAGCLWELENLMELGAGIPGKSASFPLGSVKGVKIGRGWARGGIGLLILPYLPAINQMAAGYCVSFTAPDGEQDGEVVYALHMRTKEDARRLAGCLG